MPSSPTTTPSSRPTATAGPAPRCRRRLALGVALVLTLLVPAGAVRMLHGGTDASASARDTDGDGLPDRHERDGWSTYDARYVTDPNDPDTDDDGLLDGDEAGSLAPSWTGPTAESVTTGTFYVGYSNPKTKDSDADGLTDSDEADLGLDPRDRDGDHDGLSDSEELELGTDPQRADTDGDGFEDAVERAHGEERGLSPLWADTTVSKRSYVSDFVKGFALGDWNREDSLAWLAGSLASGGASAVPGVGWVYGAAAAARDTVGSAVRGDWVGSGFSAADVVPYAGDALAIPAKAAEFVARNPEHAATVARLVSSMPGVPTAMKVRAAQRIWKDWDRLTTLGANEGSLLRLQRGRTDLDGVAAATRRRGHVQGESSPVLSTRKDADLWLAQRVSAGTSPAVAKVRRATHACGRTCVVGVRIIDVLIDEVAHEAKLGHVVMSAALTSEILKDSWLLENGLVRRVHWHFFASGVTDTIGADPAVLDRLEAAGIGFTIHLPS